MGFYIVLSAAVPAGIYLLQSKYCTVLHSTTCRSITATPDSSPSPITQHLYLLSAQLPIGWPDVRDLPSRPQPEGEIPRVRW